MIKLIKENKTISLIILLALIMRLVAINQSLWLDESIGALAVRDYTYKELVTVFLKSDNHPPLYYLDLKFWTEILGFTEFSLRLPSVIYGVLTVYFTFEIANLLSKKKRTLYPILSTFLLATSPFHIYYSQEARMYSLAAFLATLSVYSFLYLVKNKAGKSFWILFSFSITALVFTDYVPVFLLPVFWIYSLFIKSKGWWKNFLIAHLPIGLLGLLWLPIFQIQAAKGRWLLAKLPAWRQVAGGANFKQAALVWMKFVFGRVSLVNKLIYYSLVTLASIPVSVSLLNSFKRIKGKMNLILLWLIVPLALGFITSFWFPAFIYFRFLYVVPAFYLLIAKGTTIIRNTKVRNLLIICLLTVNLTGWLIYVFDENQQREQWRQVVDFLKQNMEENEVAIFEYPNPFSPVRWYNNNYFEAIGVTNSISASEVETKKKTTDVILGKPGIYYFEYLRDLSDPNRYVEEVISTEGFATEAIYSFYGVGQIFYFTNEN